MTKISTLEELRAAASRPYGAHVYISLAGGMMRSSKYIEYGTISKNYWIWNLSDDSSQTLEENQIMDRAYTNIAEAMALGALVLEN